MNLVRIIAPAALALAVSTQVQAQAPAPASSSADHAAHHAPSATTTAAPTSEGEVRKVDKEQGKVTLKHGPIPNLDMPGMTMVFRVASPKLLEAVKPGDKVRFTAENLNGALTVTALEVVGK